MSVLMLYKKSSPLKIQLILSTIGMLVASWVMYIQQGWINDDSVLYFEAARLFSAGEWKAGLNLFPWPLYSLLISGIHSITTLNIHLSAQILNAALIFISIYSLLKIITLAHGDKLTLVIAVCLLFSTSYIFGDVAAMLLRDQGFWAFMLTALVFFIKFYREEQFKDAIYWQLCAIIAILFRIEAFTYIALLPFLLLTKPDSSIGKKYNLLLKAHALNIAISVLIIIALLMHVSIQLNDLGRVREIFSAFSDIQRNFNAHISQRASIMASEVLGEPLKEFAWVGLLLTLTLAVITKSLLSASSLVPILVATGHDNIKQKMAHDVIKILTFTALIALINGILIILKVNLLSSRYVILFGLIAIIFASFSARGFIEKWQKKQLGRFVKSLLSLAVIFTLTSFVLNILPKQEGYNYQKAATDFVKIHNKEQKKVFYVSPRARFYAGAPYAGRGHDYWQYTQSAIKSGSIYEYDYLLINLDADENASAKESYLKKSLSGYRLMKIFYGSNKKKRMFVYKKESQ